MAAETFYSALHWAKKAEASAKLASELAQTEGKVIQLGFDGAIEDGQLVFKHAPGGVEVPYHLVDDVEYELDLAYNETGDLPNLTEIAVQNGGETIRFISALHRDAMTNATVADMEAVMRYNSSTGYRWLFKATYKVTPNGAKVFLLYPVVAAKDYSDKTNCITEIPQDIKLELNNGMLTLKAGSKVYVPNGFEADGVTPKFDYVTTNSDISYTDSINRQCMFVVRPSDNFYRFNGVNYVFSGASAPSGDTYMVWYDTTNNLVKITSNGGSTWDSGYSFPVSFAQSTTSGVSTILNTFNGFGYIGSTVFALPGVKGLIPNGRNEDGTLNNIEFATKSILMTTINGSDTFSAPLVINGETSMNTPAYSARGLFYQDTQPTTAGSWYDTANNYWYYSTNGTTWTKQSVYLFLSTSVNFTSGKVDKLVPQKPFRAVDYSDSSWVAAQAMPSSKYINLTLGANGSTYTAPANGILMLRGQSTTTNKAYGITNNANGCRNQIRVDSSGNDFGVFMLAQKGQSLTVTYEGSLASGYVFRFIYAEGEK